MIRTLACSLALVTLAAGCSDPAKGRCTGTLAGQPFDAAIDPESEHHAVQRQVCTQARNKTRWNLSYGEGALQITALSPDATLGRLDEVTYDLPPAEWSWFEEWRVLAPASAVVARGRLTLPGSFLKLSKWVQGTFHLELADGSALDCSFDLPQANDEGVDIDCPDEHRSDHDDHDWD